MQIEQKTRPSVCELYRFVGELEFSGNARTAAFCTLPRFVYIAEWSRVCFRVSAVLRLSGEFISRVSGVSGKFISASEYLNLHYVGENIETLESPALNISTILGREFFAFRGSIFTG